MNGNGAESEEVELFADWLDEINRRVAEVKAGTAKLVTWPELRSSVDTLCEPIGVD